MTDKLELKSSHEVVHTVYVTDVKSIFYCKPDDHDILTVLMKDGKRLYCDEVCPVDSLQEETQNDDLGKIGSLKSLEYYPEKKTTNKTSKGVFDANMPRRKAYLRGFKDGAHAHKELIANKPLSEEQVKESTKTKHVKETCKENGDFLTQEPVSNHDGKADEVVAKLDEVLNQK